MNREILFRGKTKTGDWAYGYLVNAVYYLDEQPISVLIPDDCVIYPHCEFESYEEVIPETVGQYTNLTDKNDKKIFEGDIVQHENDIGVVSYSESFAKFRVIYSQLSGNWFDFEGECCYPIALECEVIGNIHDNPELLK